MLDKKIKNRTKRYTTAYRIVLLIFFALLIGRKITIRFLELNLGVKTLYIVRHAKSSWDDPNLDDFERPLNERGKRDAPRMGKRLKEREVHPDHILSSPARRAFSTAKRIAKVLGYSKDVIKTEKKLYHAGEEQILSVIKSINDKFDVVLVFGHNPGLTEFVNALKDDDGQVIDNIPTCGIVAFELKVDHWKDIGWAKGKMLFFDFPKSRED